MDMCVDMYEHTLELLLVMMHGRTRMDMLADTTELLLVPAYEHVGRHEGRQVGRHVGRHVWVDMRVDMCG